MGQDEGHRSLEDIVYDPQRFVEKLEGQHNGGEYMTVEQRDAFWRQFNGQVPLPRSKHHKSRKLKKRRR